MEKEIKWSEKCKILAEILITCLCTCGICCFYLALIILPILYGCTFIVALTSGKNIFAILFTGGLFAMYLYCSLDIFISTIKDITQKKKDDDKARNL